METLKDIQKRFEKEKVKFYNVNLYSEALTKGNDFYTMESFMEFVRIQKINAVFGCELFDDATDYLITEEVVEKELGRYSAEEIKDIIRSDIDKYNENVYKIDFNIPFLYVIACLYEGQYFHIKIKVDRNIDESFLEEPKEKLQEIVVNNENIIRAQRIERKSILEELKKELKEIIVNDDKFLKCTNKQLRFVYIKELLQNELDEHFEPLRKFWLAEETLRGIYQEPIDFVELIWRELKEQ